MKGIAIVSICAGLTLGLQEGAATASDKPRPSAFAPLAEAPQSARARTNPFEGRPQEVIAGSKLFVQHCAECHGPKADGTMHGPSLLGAEVRQAPPGALFWILSNGVVRRGMPDWSKLPEPQRWQIVTFLKSLNAGATGSESH